MKIGRLLLIPIIIIAILATSSSAAIVQERQCGNLHAGLTGGYQGIYTDWTDDYQFNKFDPAKGKLLSVEFNATLNGSIYARAENLGGSNVTGAYAYCDADMEVQLIDGGLLQLDVTINTGPTNLGSFDGIIDFGGTSGFTKFTEGNISGNISAGNLTPYIGSGTFNLTANTTAISIAKGSGAYMSILETRGWSYACITYTYDNTHCLSGYKKDGCTGDPLAGWTITVNNSTGSWSDVTNATGYWEVCDLEDGSYTICEVPQSGWAQTDPVGCYSRTLAGVNITNINFTNQELVCISGYKVDDCTGAGLPGWTITLNNSSYSATTSTNATGYYEFCGLEPGSYDLTETLKPGYVAGATPGTVTVGCDNLTNQNFTNLELVCISGYKVDDCTGAGLPGWTITLNNSSYSATTSTNATGYYEFCGLEPGSYDLTETLKPGYVAGATPGTVTVGCDNLTNQNFTNIKLLCINGTKYDDCTQQPLAGWTINLLDASGSVIATTSTDGAGKYSFCELESGNYTVCEVLKAGWKNVTPVCIPVELECINIDDADFHNVPLLCINGTKIDDCTGLPLAGWTINLLNASGSVTATTTTDLAGKYSFCGLESGNYTVCEVLQAGWKNVTPICVPVKLVCVNIDDVDFHNVPLLCINGTKIDGLTQQPLAGWTINLYNASGSVIATTTTDGAGRYSFCGLESGNYTVCEVLQAGWTNVTAVCFDVELECDDKVVDFENVPKLCINGTKINNCTGDPLAGWAIELRDENGAVITTTVTDAIGDYSFCDLEPGNYTVCEVLQSGWKNVSSLCIPVSLVTDDSEDNDFANDPPICINGTKINDCTDEGIAGWKIFLYDANGVKIGEAITDADGKYSFCGLKQGIYYVCEEEKEGWKAVRDETGAVIGSTPSDGMSQPPASCDQPWCDDNCVCVNLDCEGAEVDFRNIPESLCINGSKINNCTGAGIEKWGIYLYDVNGEQIAATLTDRNGHYSFCGLPPGQYRVCEEIRDGWVPVTYINHSSASCLPEECTCDVCNNCIPVILNCSNSEGNDFENIPPLSIRGKVIDDCTGLGLKGWTVNLYDDKGTKLTSRTTGADGSYVFTSSTTGGLKLTAGTLYSVCEVVKDGYTPVTYHANNTSRSASPVYCIPVFLDCGETEVEDFENIPPLLISGHEFNQCTGEGLDGWTVHLKDGAGNILDTTTTDNTGYYEFSGLKPGWYTVCEDSIPEGWTSFRDDPVPPPSPAMALPGTSGAPEDCETAKCIVVNLDYCEESTDNDFENIPPFCINGTVYNNSTEVAGFPIKIENSDGTQVLSIPTDAYGEYKFCGLKAGTYTVCVDKPGWTADEPCVIVYLDCMDEQHDFDVYMGRSNVLPGIEQPAITIGDSSGAVVEAERSGEPSETTEQEDTGGREPGF